MTNEEITLRGLAAKRMLESDDFCSLFDEVVNDTARSLLETPLKNVERREELHQTCHGMLAFRDLLQHYFNQMDQLSWSDNEQETGDI